MNAANRNDPTATTAAISPAARMNGSPYVVTGPGLGSPVAVNASLSASPPSPAATAPASTATPTSTGQTALLRTPAATLVMCPAYGVAPGYPAGDSRNA